MSGSQLTEREREILDHLLGISFPGRDALRVQAGSVRVRERIGPTVVFDVDPSAPAAEVRDVVPVEASVRGERPWEVMLFVKDGFLDSIELVTYDVGDPVELPSADELEEPWAK